MFLIAAAFALLFLLLVYGGSRLISLWAEDEIVALLGQKKPK